MAKRGTKPMPTALRVISGNKGKRKVNKLEPQYRVRIPPAPPNLNEVGLKEWKRAGRLLVAQKVLTDADLAVFAGYCFAYQNWIKLTMLIKEHEMAAIMQKTPNGMWVEHATSTSASKYFKQMLTAASELGLTPSSRGRLETSGVKPEDGFGAEFG